MGREIMVKTIESIGENPKARKWEKCKQEPKIWKLENREKTKMTENGEKWANTQKIENLKRRKVWKLSKPENSKNGKNENGEKSAKTQKIENLKRWKVWKLSKPENSKNGKDEHGEKWAKTRNFENLKRQKMLKMSENPKIWKSEKAKKGNKMKRDWKPDKSILRKSARKSERQKRRKWGQNRNA